MDFGVGLEMTSLRVDVEFSGFLGSFGCFFWGISRF